MTDTQNALTPVSLDQLPAVQIGSDDDFNEIATSSDFLGRLQLFTKGKAVNRGLVKPGSYGIPGGEEVVELGDSIDVLVLARRPKALDISDTDDIIACYDVKDPQFSAIQARAGERDSGCMFGPSFLVLERSTGRFLEYFCGTKSSRSEAKKIFPFLPLTQPAIDAMAAKGEDTSNLAPHGPIPMTLTSKLVEKGSYSWHVPVVMKCSTPFKNLPKQEMIIREIQRFLNTRESKTGEAEDKPARAR